MRPEESKNSQEEDQLKQIFVDQIQPVINLYFAITHFTQKLTRTITKLQQPNLTKKQTQQLLSHASYLEQKINELNIEQELTRLQEFNRNVAAITQVIRHAGTDITPKELSKQLDAALNIPPESTSEASESEIITALQSLSLVTSQSSSPDSTQDEQSKPDDTNPQQIFK